MKITVTLTPEHDNDSADVFELRSSSVPKSPPLFLTHIAQSAVSFDDGHRVWHQLLEGPRIAGPDAYETQYCSACYRNPGVVYFSRFPFEFRGVTVRPSFWLCQDCSDKRTPPEGSEGQGGAEEKAA